jgi:hypothetical protein
VWVQYTVQRRVTARGLRRSWVLYSIQYPAGHQPGMEILDILDILDILEIVERMETWA